ncbi:hypothetical protein SDC9_163956 [bioreactor metagenome]|uniref:Uncharacterized protein n=1 Tax=bioreactor metagenome TaxID=1076179 RepID=A0A645FQB9_9ZZZZ
MSISFSEAESPTSRISELWLIARLTVAPSMMSSLSPAPITIRPLTVAAPMVSLSSPSLVSSAAKSYFSVLPFITTPLLMTTTLSESLRHTPPQISPPSRTSRLFQVKISGRPPAKSGRSSMENCLFQSWMTTHSPRARAEFSASEVFVLIASRSVSDTKPSIARNAPVSSWKTSLSVAPENCCQSPQVATPAARQMVLPPTSSIVWAK